MKPQNKEGSMKDTFRLRVVQDLAQQRSDSAAVRLGRLNAESAKAEQKLNMLLEYRDEYRERFRSKMNQDVHTSGFRNFQEFLKKLDEAIDQQRGAALAARRAVLNAQHEWQSSQIQVQAYDTLAMRHQAVQAERVKRLDQRATDEFAARAHQSKR
jgi:flagellar protein FliJ